MALDVRERIAGGEGIAHETAGAPPIIRERGESERGEERAPRRLGSVALIGAGPGDPELLTVKGLRLLRAADVVVYDRLIGRALLDEARPDARLIYVGKGPRCHTRSQDEINALLVAEARQGWRVARLKGGDPFVFGRGGEEALALVAAGVPFEVAPGISSAIAVPAYAGIPVTHRGLASSFTVVTGHEGRGLSAEEADGAQVNWSALATLGGTLVVLMGVSALPRITRRLLAAGLDPATPAAVIQQGTVAQQRVAGGPVSEIAQIAAAAGLESPAITVIGQVASLAPVLAWFDAERAARASV